LTFSAFPAASTVALGRFAHTFFFFTLWRWDPPLPLPRRRAGSKGDRGPHTNNPGEKREAHKGKEDWHDWAAPRKTYMKHHCFGRLSGMVGRLTNRWGHIVRAYTTDNNPNPPSFPKKNNFFASLTPLPLEKGGEVCMQSRNLNNGFNPGQPAFGGRHPMTLGNWTTPHCEGKRARPRRFCSCHQEHLGTL